MTQQITRKQLSISYIIHGLFELACIGLAWYFYDWRLALIIFALLWISNHKLSLFEKQVVVTIQERSKLL